MQFWGNLLHVARSNAETFWSLYGFTLCKRHARAGGEAHEHTGRSATAFARFTFALLVGRWRAFPVVFRLVLGSGQGGEASVCGGGASLCSLTPCPGPLAPLPREIPSSEAPSHPSRICARSLRRRLRRGAHDRG